MTIDSITGHEVAPEWYRWAMAQLREENRIDVAGASIEWTAWGERGQPGVLLVTGNGAHMGWWRHIAPFLADGRRVATLSWSGMGSSDWRERYSVELFVEEAMAVAEAAGLFEGKVAPVMVGHSFGGILTMLTAASQGDRLSGAILVDARLHTRSAWGDAAPSVVGHRPSASRVDAVARFRLVPRQPERNRYILDGLANEAVGVRDDGWSWRSDPNIRPKTAFAPHPNLISQARCPLMFVRGQLSDTVTDAIWAEHQAMAPSGTPFVEIPDAYHHVMLDQPIAMVAVLRALLACLPTRFA
jgi:pimeloyl-ACP methyl ester carboxylesterase